VDDRGLGARAGRGLGQSFEANDQSGIRGQPRSLRHQQQSAGDDRMGVRPLADGPNLFARLHKWAARQDENFLTESLAVVVEQLLVLAPAVGTRLIGLLTRGFIEVPPGDAGSIEIQTQVEEATGKPDLEFSTPYRLVWIEVKAESELRTGQLEGYRVLLKARKTSQKRLGLLTRYSQTYSVE